MSALIDDLRALALLIAANATPVIAAKIAKRRYASPLDLGYISRNGRRLLGDHKTWRGLVSGLCACGIVALFFDLSFGLGVLFAAVSLIADAVSSAVKRRLDLPPGTEVVGLDQLGEAFLPLILFAPSLRLDPIHIVLVGAAFVMLDIATAPLRRRR